MASFYYTQKMQQTTIIYNKHLQTDKREQKFLHKYHNLHIPKVDKSILQLHKTTHNAPQSNHFIIN